VQEMVREVFKGVTVLTIAHRLETVIDSDKILVLGDGQMLEYGVPADLLGVGDGADTSGPFADMCAALGPAAEEHLKARAAGTHAPA
jgi:ABC-type multidrug transport system fused ATPase/permease subunit